MTAIRIVKCRALVARAWTALGLVALVSAACGPRPTSAWHAEAGYRWRDLDVRGGRAGFTQMGSSTTGIAFENTVSESSLVANRILGQGAGVALGDVDGDGRVDLFLARTEGCSALFRNLGGWRFEEVTVAAGVGACGRHATGTAFADLDADADLDLVLLATTGPNTIFLNDGAGKFAEHRDLGLDTTGRGGVTVAMADVDGSGKLALYVANYNAYNIEDRVPPQQRAFSQLVRPAGKDQAGKDRYAVMDDFQRDYKLVDRPDLGGMRLSQRAAADEFYVSDGKGHFTREAMTAGRFRDATGARITETAESFTLGARFADLNGDGAPDLYVGNDFEDRDQLWFNDGRGGFRLGGWTAQRQLSNSTMGIDVGDANGDGLLDLFCVDMLANDSHRLRTQIPTSTSFPKQPGDLTSQLQYQRNSLYINRGDGTFAEAAQYAGVAASGWSWGTMFLDVDLDGWQDILVANGHLWDIMDADVQEGLQNRLNSFDWRRLRWQFPKLALKNVAYRNRGDLTFEDASLSWGFGLEDDVSHAIAAADLDGDGDLDVVVNRLDAPALILRNNAKAARVAVRLQGDAPNTQAVGAVIRLEGGAVPLQVREVAVGGLYMSHSDYVASFAMGTSDSATLVVQWRDGRRTTIAGVRGNRMYEIRASASAVTASANAGLANAELANAELPRSTQTEESANSALFVDVSADLRGHTHSEAAFDDWGRQFLLPDALSPLGPGVAWFDTDRDGNEELLVGAGKGGRIAQFQNVGGRMAPTAALFPVAAASLTGVIGVAEGTRTRLFAGVSTWQALSDSEMVAQPAVIGMTLHRGIPAAAADALVGSHASATGPIAVADYDGDDALDLFVGSRATPMGYPLPPSSGLFKSVNGRFVHDAVNAAELNAVGMVSAATFADLNGDGHADLLLAREWDSILLLLNDGRGRFTRAPASWGLDRFTSRWNGVATGDIDGDGRLDLVATSWGRNTPMQADSARPLVLWHGPVGSRGEQEMILARHDARIGGLAPLTTYARARVAIPDLVRTVGTFAAWADSSVEKSFQTQRGKMSRMKVVTLDQTAFMNRGDRFEAVPLASEAQLAPAFAAAIADFDGDGTEDLFLGQNFSQTTIGWPRADAGRGLLLQNDGTGKLVPLTGRRSGLVIYGDQRGAAYADYDGDGRLDLAVSQNAGATRLFHNRGARPALRVRVKGTASNPDGVGVQLRLVYGERMGPVREVQAGSGYWSQNGAVQLLGKAAEPTAIWVRWPGGAVTRVAVPSGAREVVVSPPPR